MIDAPVKDAGGVTGAMVTRIPKKAIWILALVGLLAGSVGSSGSEQRTITAPEAIQLAIQNDSGLRLANLNLTLARLRLEAAQNAAFLPSIGLSINPPGLTGAGLGQDAAAALSASLPLPWGQGSLQASLGLDYDLSTSAFTTPTWQVVVSDVLNLASPTEGQSSVESSERAVESAERSLAETEKSLVLSTVQSYQGLLSKAQQASQNRESVDRLEEELAQVQDLARQGYKGVQDINEAKLLLVEAQVQAEKSAATYASDLETFCRETLGIPADCTLAPLGLSLAAVLAEAHVLLTADIPEGIISSTSTVISAKQDVVDAEAALQETRGGLLPSLSISAKVAATEWKVGVGLSFNLFSPSRSANIRIAEANLAVAEGRLESARISARNQILNQRTSLLSAVRSAESLDLETEKWQLTEEVTTARRDAGTLSDSDWAAFLDQKDSFAVDAAGRATSLLVAYLTYRGAMGMELDWEEWL
jgi:outer membrane protein TolC